MDWTNGTNPNREVMIGLQTSASETSSEIFNFKSNKDTAEFELAVNLHNFLDKTETEESKTLTLRKRSRKI